MMTTMIALMCKFVFIGTIKSLVVVSLVVIVVVELVSVKAAPPYPHHNYIDFNNFN